LARIVGKEFFYDKEAKGRRGDETADGRLLTQIENEAEKR
jgi:hypothetical protein